LQTLATLLSALAVPDRWQDLDACDVLLVRGDGDCGYTFRSRAYSPVADSLGDLLAARGLAVRSVAIPYARLVGKRGHFAPVSYNRFAAETAVLSPLVRIRRGRSQRLAWLEQRAEALWSAILRRARPRYVIGINPEAALCRAARRAGAVVYDLQHGVIASGNYWYDARGRDDFDPASLPHGFLCWDEPSAASLRPWVQRKGLQLRVIGNPWFSRFLRAQPDDALAQDELSRAALGDSARPAILVSLQWGLGTFYYTQGEFNGVMVEPLERAILETADRYDWLLRLHPQHMRGSGAVDVQRYLQRTFGALQSVQWERCSRMPLPLVLRQSDLHITDASSVVIEAGWMGVKSGLLNPNFAAGRAYESVYAYERNAGLAELLPQDADSIKSWIARNLDCSRTAPAPHYADAAAGLVAEIQESCR
jgi:hypothetical protein